jgi:DNA-binding response OmpR family regulator
MRLLIAEDDTRLLKSLKHIFEANQYMVDAVSNGMDALAYAESEEYDGLIFDIMMPGMSGTESCAAIREFSSVPVLFLTAKTQEPDKNEAYDIGGDDFLSKPFEQSELVRKVKALIRRYNIYKGRWNVHIAYKHPRLIDLKVQACFPYLHFVN